MKVVIKLLSAILAFCTLFTVSASAAEKQGWYIVKHEGCTPGFPSDSSFLSEHSCYFLDEDSAKGGEKVIYLTFDAGYENGNIERILGTLRERGVPAAFFILSNLVRKNADLVKQMSDDGHLVCNHTSNHKCAPEMTKDELRENLEALEALCLERTGYVMPKYFRYPEGVYSAESALALEELGYKSFFWSVAYADWDNSNQPSAEKAIKSLIKQTHPGAIVLLHPTSSTNAEILPKMIAVWQEMGYRFGRLDELI